ncbi:hypothetical protein A2988_05005 [Candidatus Azambacteria bacterium RIFCSPLOWO2_01_FULL_46_25]|uniref:3-oxoacyl-ACP reductase n=1 Tax=Candidatus Azambacteria bacterium RIFCSPLOWO2_01_FULL_46_25 TaxID=1797298 RepID=A0A1F5BTA4_9BACT|nr:MAG: hypothetical protein A2988_05005 [Candidatus Azambacteria bacterium RIFCSPLOWO2_01_FULL_46_25]
MELKNKVVLITGSSSGIGKATALRFAKEGCKLVINYHKNRKGGEETLKGIRKIGSEAILVKADISKPKEIEKLFKIAFKKFRRIDILINNAALTGDTRREFLDTPPKKILEVINTDLISVMICSQHAVKIMRKRGGKILNTSSIRGIDYAGSTGSMVYAAAKAGVNSFTKTLAKKVAPTILVNAIAPGHVKTRAYDGRKPADIKNLINKTYLKRFITPEEIADAFVFLAKNDAITGQVITVDAGRTLLG